MKNSYCLGLFLLFCLVGYAQESSFKGGTYSGNFQKGNFNVDIRFEIVKNEDSWTTFFSSLRQNAIGIPARNVHVHGDSITFVLQSDHYTYQFKNKWIPDSLQLQGTLDVGGNMVPYILQQESTKKQNSYSIRDIKFSNEGLNFAGSIYTPKEANGKALVLLTSSGGGDRSGSRAEAIYFAKRGYTTFHYDKRGTGSSEGNWQTTSMEELLSDDTISIEVFSSTVGITYNQIVIKGSSQGATKVPYLLEKMPDLGAGIVISCPGSTLLESDLNAWKNRNREKLGSDLEPAANLQKMVFNYIGGITTKSELQAAISQNKNASWMESIWIPNLDDVAIDPKLKYSPVPYFKKVEQPMLIIQGEKDEIIPMESMSVIASAINPAINSDIQQVLLENANHSMYYVGESDFPYWATLHKDYFMILEKWLLEIGD